MMKCSVFRCVFFSVLTIVLCSTWYLVCIGDVYAAPTANELLSKFTDQKKILSLVTFESSFTDYIEADASNKNSLAMEWTIDFVGKRYRKWVINEEEEKGSSESVLNGDFTLSVSRFPDIDMKGALAIGATSYKSVPPKFWNESLRLLYISYPFGYFENSGECVSIADVVSAGKNSTFQDEQGVGLQSQTREYTIKVWFDIEKDYVVKKIVIVRRVTPPSVWDFSESQYVVRTFQKIDEHWFPANYAVRQTRLGGKSNLTPADKKGNSSNELAKTTRVLIADVTLSKVKFPAQLTESDFQIKTHIPDGTQVGIQDVPHIDHVWHNGKIVPKTDEVMLAIAQGGHKFMPGPDEPRFWLMGIGIALILFACGKKTYDYFKNKK